MFWCKAGLRDKLARLPVQRLTVTAVNTLPQASPSGFPDFVFERHASPLPALVDGRDPDHHAVIIAGGGPVGLAMALALANYRIRSVVVEADDTVCMGSRAICLSRRTLEILERLGAVAPFLEKGLAWTGGRSFYRTEPVLHFAMPHDADQRFAPMTNLQQYYIEQFLLEAAEARRDLLEVRWGTRVSGVSQSAERCTLTLESGDRGYTATGDYVIACDGARSTVRQCLGLRMTGTSYEARYVIADIEIALDLPTERLAWFDPPSAPGRTMLMHKQPDNLWRLDYQLHADEDPQEMLRPESVARVIAAQLEMMRIHKPWRLVWSSMYRAQALSLEHYREGRVLFAGDAAHLMPIFGVRGLNSGFDDAFNLAWKLAAVRGGRAPERLLDSFSQERHHAWDVNVSHAMKSTAFMAPPSRGYDVMRAAVLSLANQAPALAALINPRQSNVICYVGSSLNTHSADESSFRGGPPPGQPIPEAPVWDAAFGKQCLTQALADGFTLLFFHEGGPLPEALSGVDAALVVIRPNDGAPSPPASMPLRDMIDRRGRVQELFDMRPGTVYLIRPDGHVCARWRAPDKASIAAALKRALGFGESGKRPRTET